MNVLNMNDFAYGINVFNGTTIICYRCVKTEDPDECIECCTEWERIQLVQRKEIQMIEPKRRINRKTNVNSEIKKRKKAVN